MEKIQLDKFSQGPDFIRYFTPIITVLKELDGSGNPGEIIDRIIEKYYFTKEELELTNKNGESTIKNRIAWARFYLVKGGILDSSKRGVWSLTEKGYKTTFTLEESFKFFKKIHKQFDKKVEKQTEKKENNLNFNEKIESQLESDLAYRDDLLLLLKKLPPSGFEKLCQRLLRESGFVQVKVTKKSGDGGIDGFGILEVNPLMSFKVLFQSKRYDKSVGPEKIRDFRGALAGRADKGIFITTGYFTSEAKNEAVRDGAEPIELIDGEKLIDLFENLELGLIPRTTFDIDEEFFDEYFEN